MAERSPIFKNSFCHLSLWVPNPLRCVRYSMVVFKAGSQTMRIGCPLLGFMSWQLYQHPCTSRQVSSFLSFHPLAPSYIHPSLLELVSNNTVTPSPIYFFASSSSDTSYPGIPTISSLSSPLFLPTSYLPLCPLCPPSPSKTPKGHLIHPRCSSSKISFALKIKWSPQPCNHHCRSWCFSKMPKCAKMATASWVGIFRRGTKESETSHFYLPPTPPSPPPPKPPKATLSTPYAPHPKYPSLSRSNGRPNPVTTTVAHGVSVEYRSERKWRRLPG